MKIFKSSIITFVIFINICYSQINNNREPSILILSPTKIIHDSISNQQLRNETIIMFHEIMAVAEASKYLSYEDSIKNRRGINLTELETNKSFDILKYSSFISQHYFTLSNDTHALIKWIDEINIGIVDSSDYQLELSDFQYVLSFPSIELSKTHDGMTAIIDIQLYDRISDSILVNKTVTGNDFPNINFTFNCEGGTLTCAIKNALADVLQEINFLVYFRSPRYKPQKDTEQQIYQIK